MHLRSTPVSAGYTNNVHKLDFLAFSLVVFLAKTSSAPGFQVPGILGIIAQDATRYFLVIFTSHFVLTMTLALGRVSLAIPPSELWPLTCVSSQRSSSFQPRKSPPICLAYNRSHYVYIHQNQWQCCVSPTCPSLSK